MVDKFLVLKYSAKRAECLVVEWANIPMGYPTESLRPFDVITKASIAKSDAAIERLAKRYPEVFSAFPPKPPRPSDAQSIIPTDHWYTIAHIQRYFRLAWDAPDMRQREWHIFKARDQYHSATTFMALWEQRVSTNPDVEVQKELTDEEDAARISPPPLTTFEQAVYHFHRVADRARHCPNPECPAPYFLARKRNQKYCSSKCSAPFQRQQKREWWRRERAKQPF